jgi:hypothetical protein
MLDTASKTEIIRKLNDVLRITFTGGKVMMTATVAELPPQTKANVLSAVRQFSNFTPDNDPRGEHDFVSVEVEGQRYYGKIDYYAPDMEAGSEDPADPAKTVRVLTIMHSSDY